MESIFSRYKNALVLMLVLLAQVVLLAMQVRRPAPDSPDGHNVRLWRYLVAGVVTPPERLAHNIGLGVRGAWTNYIYLRHLRESNLTLAQENDRLRLEQASLAEDAREGQRLREMLDFKGQYIDKTVPAQVIGTSGTDQAHVIYIDKGFNDGIRTQMPVITPDGVIGKVKNVFPGTAQVLLISDQTSGAGVMLQTTRIRGVMKGNASGEPQIINISPDDRIQPGEPVLTSGGDQVYPRGLPVGIVDRVVADPDTSYINVVVKPDANLAKLEEVLVVTEIAGKMPFPQEKDMMQSEIAALQEKQKAADILSEKLPSLHEVTAADLASGGGDNTDEAVAATGGDPSRPVRPPAALHPDRYTPGAAPPAASLVPGQAPPVTHRAPTAEANGAVIPRATKPVFGAVGTGLGTPSVAGSARDAAPVNRFPAKAPPVSAAKTPSIAEASSTAASSTTAADSSNGVVPASGVARTVPRSTTAPRVSSGSGLELPLQPADSRPVRRPVSPGVSGDFGIVGDPQMARPSVPSTLGARSAGAVSPSSSASGSATTVVRAPRPAALPGTVNGVSRSSTNPSAAVPSAANGVPRTGTSSSGTGTAIPRSAVAPRVPGTSFGTPASSGATQPRTTNSLPAGTTAGSGVVRVPRPAAIQGTTTGVPRTSAGVPQSTTALPRTATSVPRATGGNSGTAISPGTTVPHTAAGVPPPTRTAQPGTVPKTASGSSTGVPAATKPATSAPRRIVIPSDSGGSGILTPAGMGQIGGGTRPKTATPSTDAAAARTAPGAGTSNGVKLNSPRPRATPGTKPPVTKPPVTRPQGAPAQTPPGGM